MADGWQKKGKEQVDPNFPTMVHFCIAGQVAITIFDEPTPDRAETNPGTCRWSVVESKQPPTSKALTSKLLHLLPSTNYLGQVTETDEILPAPQQEKHQLQGTNVEHQHNRNLNDFKNFNEYTPLQFWGVG